MSSHEILGALGDDRAAQAPSVRFLLRLAWALHRQGAPAHRLEEVLRGMAARLDLQGQFFSMPTAVLAAFGPWDEQRTFLLRVDAGDVDLTKQVELDRAAEAVAEGRMTPEEGLARIETIVGAPPRYGPWITSACCAGASGAAARFFGGNIREIAIATIVGWVLGILALVATRWPAAGRVYGPVGAVLASVVGPLLALGVGPVSTSITVLGGLIVLVPGLSVTVAMTELATRHLISGTGRLMGAVTEFLVLGLGVALGARIATLLPAASGAALGGLPAWTEAIALAVGLASFVVLFRVPAREAPWSVLTGVLVYVVLRETGAVLGPDLAVGLAAFVLGSIANTYARVRKRPAAIALVPGLMLLVPGSIGFRSLLSLLERNVLSGVETAFQMGLVAASLVTGLLLANIVLPPRRAL